MVSQRESCRANHLGDLNLDPLCQPLCGLDSMLALARTRERERERVKSCCLELFGTLCTSKVHQDSRGCLHVFTVKILSSCWSVA